MAFKPFTLNISGSLITYSQPAIMGILNVTPDSFFDGGKWQNQEAVLQQAEKMLQEGADILDIGGYSTRPGAEAVNVEMELDRTIPAIQLIKKYFPDVVISIDTFRHQVAEAAMHAGAQMVNDISAGDDDPKMFETIAAMQVPYIIMHKQGTPKTMQQSPQYQNVVLQVAQYLSEKLLKLHQLGVHDVVIDPGFGFGKTLEHNYQLMHTLSHFTWLNAPILAGVSRKSMINKVLKTSPEQALNGTTVLHTIALQNGAQLLRVHDVREAVQVRAIIRQLHDAEWALASS